MLASVAIQIIIAVVIALIGFGGGWGVKGWKDGTEIALAGSAKERVESRNSSLQSANANCATDIEGEVRCWRNHPRRGRARKGGLSRYA